MRLEEFFMRSKFAKTLVVFFTIVLALTGCATPSQDDGKADKTAGFDYETDVVVVGGGGAGLVAAISAAEEGAEVILLEKLAMMGGATMVSAGIIPAAGTRFQDKAGISDTPKAMARDIFRPGHYSQRADLVNFIAENSSDIVEWLEELGVKWHLQTDILYKGQTNYRMHQAEGQGGEIVKVLKSAVEGNDKIKVMVETPGTGLITDDGKVIGVTAKTKDDKEIKIKAKSVVLATSGFAANEEMMKEYIPQAEGSYLQVAPGATGEGIKWGMELGAKVANMTAYQGYAPISNKTKDSLGSFILNSGGILINKDTERFTDEYLGYSELSAHIVNQPSHVAYMIFDSTIAEKTKDMDKYREEDILVSGNTPEELAEKLDLDPAKLKEAFDDYMEGINKGEDRFNRIKLPEKWEGPFYAIEVTSDLRHTQGGLVTDTKARVVKADGNAIPGLYAAGGVTEGFSSSGGPAYMSGNGLLQAFVFGRVAGQEAAK